LCVNPKDGCCRSCGGTLTIIDCDDATMTVECDCGDSYAVETDAFRDGALHYHPLVLAEKLQKGGKA
jgi:hypothetical protein